MKHLIVDEPPHFLNGENCMGESYRSWRQFLVCSDGTYVCGYGKSSEDASKIANEERNKRELWIKSDVRERIKKLVTIGCRGTQEQNDLNKALAQLLGII